MREDTTAESDVANAAVMLKKSNRSLESCRKLSDVSVKHYASDASVMHYANAIGGMYYVNDVTALQTRTSADHCSNKPFEHLLKQ